MLSLNESFDLEELERDGLVITSIHWPPPRCQIINTTANGDVTASANPTNQNTIKPDEIQEPRTCQIDELVMNRHSPLVNIRPKSTQGELFHCSQQFLKSQIWKHGLEDYFSIESSLIEDYMWNSNFFGYSSVSQLTYTMVYLVGKVLCLRTGWDLFNLHMWNSFEFVPVKKNRKTLYDYDLFYPLSWDLNKPLKERLDNKSHVVVLDHFIIRKEDGLVIKHSVKNNHQKCLVCYHGIMLQRRFM